MPIEVRELTIKAKVESSGSSAPASGSNSDTKMKDDQINMIVDKVLRILKERMER